MLNSSPKHLVLACDAWYGVAHGCTRKLGMKICGKFWQCSLHIMYANIIFGHLRAKTHSTFTRAVAPLTQV